MARKTVIVSDLSGERAIDPVRVVITYKDGSRREFDADRSEMRQYDGKGERRARRGRPKVTA